MFQYGQGMLFTSERFYLFDCLTPLLISLIRKESFFIHVLSKEFFFIIIFLVLRVQHHLPVEFCSSFLVQARNIPLWSSFFGYKNLTNF